MTTTTPTQIPSPTRNPGVALLAVWDAMDDHMDRAHWVNGLTKAQRHTLALALGERLL